MSTRVISRNQWVALQSGSLPIVGHFLLVANVLRIAGRDAWISVLISIPVGFLFAAVLLALRRRWKGTPLIDGIYHLAGPVGGTLISALLALYFFSIGVITLRGLEQFIVSVFMPETPYLVIGISFILLVAWAMYRDIEAVARTAIVLVLFIIITGTTVGFSLLPEKHYVRIFPLLENGWSPVLAGALLFSSIWSELISVLVFRSKPYSLKREAQGWTALLLFNGILFILSVLSAVTMFDMPLATHFAWPAQAEVRLIKFGMFDRNDIYGLFTMTAGSLIRITLFLFSACETIAHVVPISSYKSAIWPVAAATLIVSLLPFWNDAVYSLTLKFFYTYTFLFILIPLGLLLLPVKNKT
ncbi:MAG: GerAB/ArcD/ProY family transporter [Bacilli bacterium]